MRVYFKKILLKYLIIDLLQINYFNIIKQGYYFRIFFINQVNCQKAENKTNLSNRPVLCSASDTSFSFSTLQSSLHIRSCLSTFASFHTHFVALGVRLQVWTTYQDPEKHQCVLFHTYLSRNSMYKHHEFCLRMPGVLLNTTKISSSTSLRKIKELSELHVLLSMKQVNMDSKAHGLE